MLDVKALLTKILEALKTDYIIEEGTNYRKWNSGKAECWGEATATVNVTSQSNGTYYTSRTMAFPISFASRPTVFPSVSQDSGVFFAAIGNISTLSTTQVQVRVLSNTSQSNKSITFAYYAIGKWK